MIKSLEHFIFAQWKWVSVNFLLWNLIIMKFSNFKFFCSIKNYFKAKKFKWNFLISHSTSFSLSLFTISCCLLCRNQQQPTIQKNFPSISIKMNERQLQQQHLLFIYRLCWRIVFSSGILLYLRASKQAAVMKFQIFLQLSNFSFYCIQLIIQDIELLILTYFNAL